MPVSGEELVTLLIALFATSAVVLLIRRASNKNQLGDAGRSGKAALPQGRPRKGDEQQQLAKEDETEEEDGLGAEKDQRESLPLATDTENEVATSEDERRYGEGLAKTRSSGFVSKLGKLFARKKIDANLIEELEEVLFTADIGPKTAKRLLQAVKEGLSKNELEDPSAVWEMLRQESIRILDLEQADVDLDAHSPFVLLVLGVNGAGKTTTIGKLAAKYTAEGKKVLLAAGDTFRAAAVEQLEVWGERAGCPVVRGKDGADPSSVIFEAIRQGRAEGYDIVIADTAGRLHTKTELMEELKKVGRVCDKAMPGCPHETWLVLDSTTGQNAIQQAIHFKDAMDITGIVLTKLDGTAKGGVVLGISEEMQVPIRFIGIGEKIDDLRPFSPQAFVSALFQDQSEDRAA